jgi:hypothetical protein
LLITPIATNQDKAAHHNGKAMEPQSAQAGLPTFLQNKKGAGLIVRRRLSHHFPAAGSNTSTSAMFCNRRNRRKIINEGR